MELVGVDPPKHFYVDLKDQEGRVYRKVYVSKHFNDWRSLKMGTKITAYRTTKKHRETGEIQYDFDHSALNTALHFIIPNSKEP